MTWVDATVVLVFLVAVIGLIAFVAWLMSRSL